MLRNASGEQYVGTGGERWGFGEGGGGAGLSIAPPPPSLSLSLSRAAVSPLTLGEKTTPLHAESRGHGGGGGGSEVGLPEKKMEIFHQWLPHRAWCSVSPSCTLSQELSRS